MNLSPFFDNFDLLTDAPNGVQKLRELILQLAVRGQLVPQDPEDQPASFLLQAIRVEKEQQVKARANGKAKSVHTEKVANDFFDLPLTWAWSTLDDITLLITDGEHATPPRTIEAKVPLGTAKNVRDGFLDLTITDYVPFDIAEKCWKRCKPKHNDILMVCVGATTGRLCLLKEPPEFVIVRSVALIRSSAKYIHPEYVALSIKSPFVQSRIWSSVKQSAQPCLYINRMQKLHIPLPPLAEQKRIVAKVDRLMSLCDELEERKKQRRSHCINLNNGAVTQLLNVGAIEEFDHHWQRICNNFDLLCSLPENVTKLRQAIVQLALQGKLVQQNSDDEPASTLLEGISKDREQLLKEKKIPSPRKIPEILDDELPFALPDSWEWTRLGELCFQVSDGPHFSPSYVSKDIGIPFLSTRNIKINGIELESAKYISQEDFVEFCKRIKPEPGDILYTKGGTTGIATVNTLDIEFAVWVHVAVLKFAQNFVNPQYLAYALNSLHCYALSQKYTHGSSNKDLGLTRMILITVPLPPLAEQKRIVAKVDRLMSFCDQLEAKLTQTQGSSEKLMKVVVRQVLAV